VINSVKCNGDLIPLRVVRVGKPHCHDLLGCKLLLPFLFVGVRPTEDVINLLMSFGEVALRVFGLLVLLDLFGGLENLVYKTFQSIPVPSLVFPLIVKDVDSIKETFKLI
jgi:hypothetical protein